MSRDALQGRLAAHPFLKGLKPAHLRLLADCAMDTEFRPDEVLFRAGDPANRFYLIESGRVLLEYSKPDAGPVRVQVIGPGDVLGWSWLFPPYLWNFDARAEIPTRAIFFYGTRLREQCEQDYEFGYELITRMSAVMLQRLQALRRHVFG